MKNDLSRLRRHHSYLSRVIGPTFERCPVAGWRRDSRERANRFPLNACVHFLRDPVEVSSDLRYQLEGRDSDMENANHIQKIALHPWHPP